MPINTDTITAPALTVKPLSYPKSCDPCLKEQGFGVIVEGVRDINNITPSEFIE